MNARNLLGEIEDSQENGDIDCSIYSPQSLQLVKIPIDIKVLGDLKGGEDDLLQLVTKDSNVIKFEEPIKVVYRIKNLCEDHIF